MSPSAMLDEHLSTVALTSFTAEWELLENSPPSGGNVYQALRQIESRDAAPSGSGGRVAARHMLISGIVLAAAALAGGGGQVGRVPADISGTAPATPAVVARRREDDDAPLLAAPAAAEAVVPAPAEPLRPAGATAVATDVASSTAEETVGVGHTTEGVITAADQVGALQEALGLSITHIADLVHVARGTVYGWISGDVELPRDPAKVQRLRDLYRVARMWRDRSGENLGRLAMVSLGDEQPSLLELLASDEWDEPGIDRALTVLAERVEARNRDRQQARERGVGRARPVTPETVELERHALRSLA